MKDERIDLALARFGALRGAGPYNQTTMMEAALLAEELIGVVLSDEQMNEENFSTADRFEIFLHKLTRD